VPTQSIALESATRILGFPLWLGPIVACILGLVAFRNTTISTRTPAATFIVPILQVLGLGIGTLLAVTSLGIVAGLSGKLGLVVALVVAGFSRHRLDVLGHYSAARLSASFSIAGGIFTKYVSGVLYPAAARPLVD